MGSMCVKDGPVKDCYKETLEDLRDSFKRLRKVLVSSISVYYSIPLHATVEEIQNVLERWIVC